MSGAGDTPNFTFTIAGIDHLQPPYYIEAIRISTNRLRFYVDNPFFSPMSKAMVPYTGILLEADAVGYHIAQESKRVYAASCAGGHTLSRSTLFGPMPDVPRTLDIPRPIPGASTWTTRAFRQSYEFVKATSDLMSTRLDCDIEGTAMLWEKVHTLLRGLLTQERIEVGIKMIAAAQAYAQTNRPVLLDGYMQTREDPHTFVNFVDGTFAHVWRDAREARRFVASSQRLWQTILEHRVLPVLCPVTVMMQSRGRSVTFTPLMPIHGEPIDNELAPTDILRLLSALVGNTGGHHRFGQASAKMTDNGEAEEIADAKDQPLAAPAQNVGMYCGADGYCYITRPTAFGIILEHLRGGKTIAVPYAPLRLEVYHKVFPDGVSKERGWTANDAVTRIMETAFEPVVKALVRRARTKVTDLVQRGFITALFRQYGLNIRFAFLVLKEALALVPPRTPEEMAITDALEAEMLCRAVKTMYRADVAIFPNGVMSDEDYLERANRLLYYINGGSRPIWEQISTVVRGKFIGCPPDYSIPPTPKMARIITWYMTPKMGFNFNAEEGTFDKVSAALPVWYGCYSQPESVRHMINGKLDAAANHLGQLWQWLEGSERPPMMEYQRAVEVGRWKKINARLAPEDPAQQHISEDGQRLDMTVLHQQHRSQVFELLSHCVRVLGLTRICQIDDEVVQMRLVRALDTALRYRNTNSAVYAHLCSLLIDTLSFVAKEASITHPIADVFEDTCKTVYFYGTRLVQSMCVNFTKIQGNSFEGTRAGNLFFISQVLLTAGTALTRDSPPDRAAYRPYSAGVMAVTGVATDAPPLYDYPHKAQTVARLSLKSMRGAQYTHAGMTLKLHYHTGRLAQIGNRVLSRPRLAEHSPAYIDFRVNPDLMETVLKLGKENLTLHIVGVALLTHQSSIIGAHLDLKERQREEFVKLSTRYFTQTAEERRFVNDDLFVGLSMAALQYLIDIPCGVSDEERYSDAEVVMAFTRLLAASLVAVEQVDNKVIKPIVECHKAVNKVYPTRAKNTGLFFSKTDFDLIKSAIQSPMFARNLSLVMDDVLLVRRMWVILNVIRLIYYKGSIIYDKDEDLEEAVSVADWCNKMADVQRAYAYRRLNGRFPDGTPQREREIAHIKARLARDGDLYSIGIHQMERWRRNNLENIHLQSLEDAARRTAIREAEEWCLQFHFDVFTYKQTIGVVTCQMEQLLARNTLEEEECLASEDLFRNVYIQMWTGESADLKRIRDTTAAVMHCDWHFEPSARRKIEDEQITAMAKIITTTYFCYAYMPAIYKNGYMREALKSYEDCIVYGSRQLILNEEHTAFTETLNAYNTGYFGDAMDRLFTKEADLRKRMVIHERSTFNVGVFTPIETMSRALVASTARLEWQTLIEHPHQVLTDILIPEENGRALIEGEQLVRRAELIYELSLKERHEIEVYGGELRERVEVLCPLHETFERIAFVEGPCVTEFIDSILVPAEAERRWQYFEVELGVFADESFYRRLIGVDECHAQQRDLMYQMASHRMIEVLGGEWEAEFAAIYDRYQIESGQFRAADFEEYEEVLREELAERYLSQCLQEIIFAKIRDYGDTLVAIHTTDLLIGIAEREEILRREIELGIPSSEREVYSLTMASFEEDLTAKEQWERARLMAQHSVILEEFDSRVAHEILEAKRFYGITMASDLLLSQLRGLGGYDSSSTLREHPSLCPIVARHWRRVVAEQKHADANAPNALPYRFAAPQFATSYAACGSSSLSSHKKGDIVVTDTSKYDDGPMVFIVAQREALKMMRAIMPEPEYAEIIILMEEAVRRNELIEWYGHFIATARAEWENIMILIAEHPFASATTLLSCVPTAASINVAPLLLQPSHVVSRMTAHARRLVLTAGHEVQKCYDLEAPIRSAYARRHRELVVELRKPPHRRQKRILNGGGGGAKGPSFVSELAPVLETGLLPVHPAEVPSMIAALAQQQYHLLKLLLYEDTAPVEATLRLRLQVAEHRAAMGLWRAMKEEKEAVARGGNNNNNTSTNSIAAAFLAKGPPLLSHPSSQSNAFRSTPFASLNASLFTISAKSAASDLSLIPVPMIALAKAIAEGRYYNTIHSTHDELLAGAILKPPSAAFGQASHRKRGAGPRLGGEDGSAGGDGARAMAAAVAAGAALDTPFDVTSLPPFRVYEDCDEATQGTLPSLAYCSPLSIYAPPPPLGLGLGSSRPGSGSVRGASGVLGSSIILLNGSCRRSRPNSALSSPCGGLVSSPRDQRVVVGPNALRQRPPSSSSTGQRPPTPSMSGTAVRPSSSSSTAARIGASAVGPTQVTTVIVGPGKPRLAPLPSNTATNTAQHARIGASAQIQQGYYDASTTVSASMGGRDQSSRAGYDHSYGQDGTRGGEGRGGDDGSHSFTVSNISVPTYHHQGNPMLRPLSPSQKQRIPEDVVAATPLSHTLVNRRAPEERRGEQFELFERERLNRSAPAKSLVGSSAAAATGSIHFLAPLRRPLLNSSGANRSSSNNNTKKKGQAHKVENEPTAGEKGMNVKAGTRDVFSSPAAALSSKYDGNIVLMDAVYSPSRNAPVPGDKSVTGATNSSGALVFHKRTAKPNRLPTLW